MSKYLISTTEVHRADTEQEATSMIEAAKRDRMFTLTKSATEFKEIKSKGEVIDSFYKVTLVKTFTNIKEPDCQVEAIYNWATILNDEVNDDDDE